MKSIDQYPTLKDFTDDLEKSGFEVPYKIMGQRKKPKGTSRGNFHSATMLAQVYNEISDPDKLTKKAMPFDAPFGIIGNRFCRLDPSDTYSSSLTPHPKDGSNLFQGDILNYSLPIPGIPQASYSMLVSHSCGITREPFVQLIPVYKESELNETIVTTLKGQKPKNVTTILRSWFQNENWRFLGLPSVDIGSGDDGEQLLGCLCLLYPLPLGSLPTAPKFRLKYRALTYFQLRLSHLYGRDVQDSDETRDI